MPLIQITSTRGCPYCDKAKAELRREGLAYQEHILDTKEKKVAFQRSGLATVPQIYINGTRIGGYQELVDWLVERSTETGSQV